MDDPVVMRVVESVDDLQRIAECRVGRRSCLTNDRAERPAGHVPHNDEGAVVAFTDLVDRADVRVIENRRVSGLADEAPRRRHCHVSGGVPDECLDRDLTSEERVACAIDLAHSTSCDEIADLVAADARPRLQPRRRLRVERRAVADETNRRRLPKTHRRQIAREQ